jgi:O-methyltransferase
MKLENDVMQEVLIDSPSKKAGEGRSADYLRHLYLDLMKRSLTDSIYINDALSQFVFYKNKSDTPLWKRAFVSALERLLAAKNIQMVEPYSQRTSEEISIARKNGTDWPPRAHTMIGLKRLDNLQFCIENVINDDIPGDFIETGVWRGGACIFMRAILKAYGDNTRTVWLADSFAGLPQPNAADYPADEGDSFYTHDVLAVSRDQVEDNFRRYDLLDDRVKFLVGWFKDTLPTAPLSRLAVLRLDGDLYESTIQALNALYDKLSPGGYVIVDDYQLATCAKAIHDFRKARGINDEIHDIDGMGVFWRRSK